MNLSSNIPGLSHTGTSNPTASAIDGSFRHYILKEQPRYWKLAIPVIIAQLVIFKLLYPYPDFISDSYSYIDSAVMHMNVNLWPIGYSKVIWLLHKISHTSTFLVSVQFLALEISLLLFFYTFLYFHRPAKNTTNILFFMIFCNPIFMWLSNAVLSDALFNCLSLLWWVQFIWMLHRPRVYQVFVLAGLLGIVFTLRYTAMYYPIVAGVAYALSAHKLQWKIMGTALCVAVMIPFIIFTQQETKKYTGTAEFSVFGGWQIANNALYMYDHIEVDSTKLPPGSVAFDRMVRGYFKAVPPQYRELDPFPGTFFIKTQDAPLKAYSYPFYKSYDPVGQFKAWGAVSPMYNAYGTYLIKHNPLAFARYYLWLNAKNYFVPHLEKFGIYNFGSDSVWEGAKYWFRWPSLEIHSLSGEALPNAIFFAYPAIFMVLNLYFIAAFCWLFITGRWRRLPPFFIRCLWLLAAYLAVNFAFSIFATPVVLRYQVMPYLLLLSYSLALLELTDQTAPAKAAPVPAPPPATA